MAQYGNIAAGPRHQHADHHRPRQQRDPHPADHQPGRSGRGREHRSHPAAERLRGGRGADADRADRRPGRRPRPAAPAPRVVADDRSNSVLVSGDSAQRLRIATLDRAPGHAASRTAADTRVLYLRMPMRRRSRHGSRSRLTGVAAATPGTAARSRRCGRRAAADRSVTIWADKQTNALDHHRAAEDHALADDHHRRARHPPRAGARSRPSSWTSAPTSPPTSA